MIFLCAMMISCAQKEDIRLRGIFIVDVGQTASRLPFNLMATNVVADALVQQFGSGEVLFTQDEFIFKTAGTTHTNTLKIAKSSTSFTIIDVMKSKGAPTRLRIEYEEDGFWAYDLSSGTEPLGYRFRKIQ